MCDDKEGLKPVSDAQSGDLLEARGLSKSFPARRGTLFGRRGMVKAVRDLEMNIRRGETLGLVGESGCGKSTLGRMLAGLEIPSSGTVCFEGKNIHDWRRNKLTAYRRKVQLIFQDPYASLNPRRTAGDTIAEPILLHEPGASRGRKDKVARLMEIVGLAPEQMARYPHEFSGGQRQRIGIARALALQPKLLIADEPVSALDVSIQSQILNLFSDLQQKFGLTYLFISHNLSVIRYISDRVAVMYLGKIVDLAPKEEFFHRPLHPYTRVLLSSIPLPQPGRRKERIIIKGDLPNPISIPDGCAFHPRCPFGMDVCREIEPQLLERGGEHFVACHLRE